MCMGILAACMSLDHVCAMSLEVWIGIRSSRIRVTDSCKLLHGSMNWTWVLKEQPMVLITEPYLQPLHSWHNLCLIHSTISQLQLEGQKDFAYTTLFRTDCRILVAQILESTFLIDSGNAETVQEISGTMAFSLGISRRFFY